MRISLIVVACLLCFVSRAQDPHFSQYYASPATINPAHTGAFKGDARLSGIYRQQYPQYGTPFTTGTFSIELKTTPTDHQDYFGYGAMILFDKTPDGALKTDHAYTMLAYHKSLDREGLNKLTFGVMAGYNQKRLDASHFTFGSQFQSGGFTGNAGEVIPSSQQNSFDVHAGLLYSFEDEDKLLYAGGSLFHLLQPKNTFFGNIDNAPVIHYRLNANAGFNIKTDAVIYAGSVLFMRQENINELLLGGMAGFPFGSSGTLYLGGWYRMEESLIPGINVQWQNFNVGASYDVFVNHQKTMVHPTSFELSMVYTFSHFTEPTGCFHF